MTNKAFKLDRYNNQIIFYEQWSDGSRVDRFYIYEGASGTTLHVDAAGWKFFGDCPELLEIMKDGAVGKTLDVIAEILIDMGWKEI